MLYIYRILQPYIVEYNYITCIYLYTLYTYQPFVPGAASEAS